MDRPSAVVCGGLPLGSLACRGSRSMRSVSGDAAHATMCIDCWRAFPFSSLSIVFDSFSLPLVISFPISPLFLPAFPLFRLLLSFSVCRALTSSAL